jgi:hypothetical protein
VERGVVPLEAARVSVRAAGLSDDLFLLEHQRLCSEVMFRMEHQRKIAFVRRMG